MRYYEIARLTEGVSIEFSDDLVRVDLDKITLQDSITNDAELQAAQGKGVYFYLSGGGTILINGRYMPVVKRAQTAKINPNKYSLFTGRAEGMEEWKKPESVTRELFEELHIYKNGEQLIPQCQEFQEIIDATYSAAPITNNHLKLKYIPLHNVKLQARHFGVENTRNCFLHIGENGDINLLFVFAVDIELDGLEIRDGEALNSGGGREVLLLDIGSNGLQKITGEKESKMLGICDKEQMTPHLSALVDAVKVSLKGK